MMPAAGRLKLILELGLGRQGPRCITLER